MCLLIAMKPGACPDELDLWSASQNNPDGYGYAIVVGDHIVTHRGMSASKVITDFLTDRARWPDGPAIWHARFATQGDVNKVNCHPFRVGGSQKMYLAHNGVLPLPYNKAENRSDSRIFAEDLLPQFGSGALDSLRSFHALEDWLGTDKVAVLSVDPGLKKQLYILNESAGHWGTVKDGDEGIWYSNYSYYSLPETKKLRVDEYADEYEYTDEKLFGDDAARKAADIAAWWKRHGDCEACGCAMDQDDDVCPYCDTCKWCGSIAPADGNCRCGEFEPDDAGGSRAALDILLSEIGEDSR